MLVGAARARRAGADHQPASIAASASAPAAHRAARRRRKHGGKGEHRSAFALVFRTRYLLLMALMLMLLNWVNTTGEYILGSIVKQNADAAWSPPARPAA